MPTIIVMKTTPKLYCRPKNGVWIARWRESGRQRQHSFETKDQRLAKVLFETWLVGRIAPEPERPLVVLDAFLHYLRTEGLREVTVEDDYAKKLRPLVTAWADVPVTEWARPMLEAYFREHSQWSVSYRQKIVTRNRRFRDWMILQGINVPDYIGKWRWRKQRAPRKVVYELRDILDVLAEVREHKYLELPVALAAFAALSEGDIPSIDWSEIDREAWIIRRPRQKTGAPIRAPVIPALREVLLRAWLKQGRPESGPVCADLPSLSSLAQALKRAEGRVDKARRKLDPNDGLPATPRGQGGWRRYRRSCATALMRMGAPREIIAEILAHAPDSPATFEYEVIARSDVDAVMAKLGDAFEEARQSRNA